ncbi:potassium voltage-gated channel subfamily G member 4-like protein [Lates japonicus]|uniref:Potassium voltage-gated channel subfamily G member 4-like protein n=1 Tax=Lates japonicus TaxID=270547 RepID=A0AAD3M703_LATJO|nr:potassium voltage-gated channel subfamily G member 4-like protein [Lates japonicus]
MTSPSVVKTAVIHVSQVTETHNKACTPAWLSSSVDRGLILVSQPFTTGLINGGHQVHLSLSTLEDFPEGCLLSFFLLCTHQEQQFCDDYGDANMNSSTADPLAFQAIFSFLAKEGGAA